MMVLFLLSTVLTLHVLLIERPSWMSQQAKVARTNLVTMPPAVAISTNDTCTTRYYLRGSCGNKYDSNIGSCNCRRAKRSNSNSVISNSRFYKEIIKKINYFHAKKSYLLSIIVILLSLLYMKMYTDTSDDNATAETMTNDTTTVEESEDGEDDDDDDVIDRGDDREVHVLQNVKYTSDAYDIFSHNSDCSSGIESVHSYCMECVVKQLKLTPFTVTAETQDVTSDFEDELEEY